MPFEDLPQQEWIERARAHRADYQLAKASLNVADANVALQDALGVPNPDVGLIGIQQQGVAFLGVGISYPIPLLNRNEGERQKARWIREQARADVERLERQIATEITVAYGCTDPPSKHSFKPKRCSSKPATCLLRSSSRTSKAPRQLWTCSKRSGVGTRPSNPTTMLLPNIGAQLWDYLQQVDNCRTLWRNVP